MGFKIGNFLSGGMQGYAFVKNQQGQEDERLRKKKEGDRADVAYGREEAIRTQLEGNPSPAAQGVTPPSTGHLAAGAAPSPEVQAIGQGIPTQVQPAQTKSWDDRVREYKDIESKISLSPDGGAKFKGRLDLERQKLMSEKMQEVPLPDNGKIDDAYAQKYSSHFAKAAQALGAVVTPEMVSAAAQGAKKLAAENIDKAQSAAESGDIDLANKYGSSGDMRWNLSNKKQVKLPNGATVYQYDNTMPDGKVVTFNTFESGKRLLDNAAKLKFILEEQKGMTEQTKARNEAVAKGVKPYKVEYNEVSQAFSEPATDRNGKPVTNPITGAQQMNRNQAKENAFIAWMKEQGITDTNEGLAKYMAQPAARPAVSAIARKPGVTAADF